MYAKGIEAVAADAVPCIISLFWRQWSESYPSSFVSADEVQLKNPICFSSSMEE